MIRIKLLFIVQMRHILNYNVGYSVSLLTVSVRFLAPELIFLLRECDVIARVMINIASVKRSCSCQQFSK